MQDKVRRLMQDHDLLLREHDLQPRRQRRYVATTDGDHDLPSFPNLAKYMTQDEPDMTYSPSPLRPGNVVLVDTSKFIEPRVYEMIAAVGTELPYTPSYSLDLNSIETAFSKLKALSARPPNEPYMAYATPPDA